MKKVLNLEHLVVYIIFLLSFVIAIYDRSIGWFIIFILMWITLFIIAPKFKKYKDK